MRALSHESSQQPETDRRKRGETLGRLAVFACAWFVFDAGIGVVLDTDDSLPVTDAILTTMSYLGTGH